MAIETISLELPGEQPETQFSSNYAQGDVAAQSHPDWQDELALRRFWSAQERLLLEGGYLGPELFDALRP